MPIAKTNANEGNKKSIKPHYSISMTIHNLKQFIFNGMKVCPRIN